MLQRIGRERHALRLNRIANDPSVYRWVKGYSLGKLDLTGPVADPNNVLLMGEHGGVFFRQIQAGLYEAHAQVLPAGRGKWAVMMARATAHWMFTRTDAMELMSARPHGNVAARALTELAGARFLFTNPIGSVLDNDPIPADVYSLTIHEWQQSAPGPVDRGEWFRKRLGEEYARLGKPGVPMDIPPGYDRYIGAAIEAFMGGQAAKGFVLYSRFAAMAGMPPIGIVQTSPKLAISFNGAIIVIRDDDVYVVSV